MRYLLSGMGLNVGDMLSVFIREVILVRAKRREIDISLSKPSLTNLYFNVLIIIFKKLLYL